MLIQVAQGFELSLFRWKSIVTKFFVGFDNYIWLFKSDVFWKSLGLTMLYMLVTTVASIVIGFTLGYFIYLNLRGRGFFRTVFFIPTVLASVAVGYIWKYIYSPSIGIGGQLMSLLGFDPLAGPLSEGSTAIWAVMIVHVWANVGVQVMMFNAGFNGISEDVLEYATLDGCVGWKMVYHMMIPMSWDVVKMIIILQVIGSLRAFDLIFVMTGGGPNHATEILPMSMYTQAFVNLKFGEGSAIAVVIFVLCMGLTMLLRKILKKELL